MNRFARGAALLVWAGLAVPARAAEGHEVERLRTAESDIYGEYVADARGRALYLFTPDKPREGGATGSTCYGSCAKHWPPVLARGLPELGPGLDSERLGTVRRPGGAIQLTYGGWPLYYYAGDEGTGSLAGQDMRTHGGAWYLIAPDGAMVRQEEG